MSTVDASAARACPYGGEVVFVLRNLRNDCGVVVFGEDAEAAEGLLDKHKELLQ